MKAGDRNPNADRQAKVMLGDARTENERVRAMLHDLIVAVLEGRETREDEPVPRSMDAKWHKALRKALRPATSASVCRCIREDGSTQFNINCPEHGKAP